jgi:3-oxoacyl-[acyl-carrier protein] reductase
MSNPEQGVAGGLSGRVAIVTGAGSGIGREIAHWLALAGADVVVNDIDSDAAHATASAIGGMGAEVITGVGDVAQPKATERLMDIAAEAFGGLDILINNAGIQRDRMLHRMSDDDWLAVYGVNLTSVVNCCRSAARLLCDRPASGRDYHKKVVNISSISGIYGTAVGVPYSTTKAGINALTRALAAAWARDRVNVNAIAPGFIAGTRLTAVRESRHGQGLPQELFDSTVESVPIGRAGEPADIAALAWFLCTSYADFLTGQVIEAHGGLGLSHPAHRLTGWKGDASRGAS